MKDLYKGRQKMAEKELERIFLILDSHIYNNQSVRLGHFYRA